MQCLASLAVRDSLRQSILHGLSRQHTAIGQEILFVILIGLPEVMAPESERGCEISEQREP